MDSNDKILNKLLKISKEGSSKDFDFLLNSINNENVSNLAINILSNVKDTSLKRIIGEKLKKKISNRERTILTSICWQSSLDFSEYFEVFIDNIIEGELDLVIESISVIEDIIDQDNINEILVKKHFIKIESMLYTFTGNKLLLVKELLSVFNKV